MLPARAPAKSRVAHPIWGVICSGMNKARDRTNGFLHFGNFTERSIKRRCAEVFNLLCHMSELARVLSLS